MYANTEHPEKQQQLSLLGHPCFVTKHYSFLKPLNMPIDESNAVQNRRSTD